MRSFILILAVFSASQSLAAGAIVRDGGTVEVGGVTYRLDGIDAPELDQICIDEHADAWACGVEARDQLSNLIGSRQVRCEDLGLGTTYRKRHIGICTLEGETASLNQLLVRQGFALNFEPYARGRFREDEAAAKANRRAAGLIVEEIEAIGPGWIGAIRESNGLKDARGSSRNFQAHGARAFWVGALERLQHTFLKFLPISGRFDGHKRALNFTDLHVGAL